MTVSSQALIHQLDKLPGNLKAEIVDNTILPISMAGGLSSRTTGLIFATLLDYTKRTGQGVALPSNAAFIVNLPNRNSFSPDASYCIGLTIDQNFVNGAPVFAAEVRSKNDYGPKAERAILAKIADYFAAGTLVVWDVDALHDKTVRVYRAETPDQFTPYGIHDEAEAAGTLVVWDVDALHDRTVRVYRAETPDQFTLYGIHDEAEAEPALPGWQVAVNTLFSS